MSDRLSPTNDSVIAKPVAEDTTATRLLEDSKPDLKQKDSNKPESPELPEGFPKTRIDSESISFAPEAEEVLCEHIAEREIAKVHLNYAEIEATLESKLGTPEAITSQDLESAVKQGTDAEQPGAELRPTGGEETHPTREQIRHLFNATDKELYGESEVQGSANGQTEVAPAVPKEVAAPIELAPDLQKVLPLAGEDGPQVYLNGKRAQPTEQTGDSVRPMEAVKWQDPVDENAQRASAPVPFTLGGNGTSVSIGGNRDFLNEFRFSGNSTISDTTGIGNNNVDFFPSRWNGVEATGALNRDASGENKGDANGKKEATEFKLSPEQEKAEKEMLDKAQEAMEKLKLEPLFKGQGPYQSIERMVRTGKLPHMTSEEIKENAVRIRNRDFDQMKRSYYKVGERPDFYSKEEIQERLQKLKEQNRKRLMDAEKSAA